MLGHGKSFMGMLGHMKVKWQGSLLNVEDALLYQEQKCCNEVSGHLYMAPTD